jgi:hypothetical protein
METTNLNPDDVFAPLATLLTDSENLNDKIVALVSDNFWSLI